MVEAYEYNLYPEIATVPFALKVVISIFFKESDKDVTISTTLVLSAQNSSSYINCVFQGDNGGKS